MQRRKAALAFAALCVMHSLHAAEPDNPASPTSAQPMPATVVPSSLLTEPSALLNRAAVSATSLVDSALAFLGVSYRFGGNNPESGFDCSGLVRRAFQDALGLNLPRTAREMANMGKQVRIEDLKPGDLVFFNTMRAAFSHVGIYLGDNKFVHAPSEGGVVRVEDMRIRYWAQRFNGARRVGEESAQN